MNERAVGDPKLTAEEQRLYHKLLRTVTGQRQVTGSFPTVSEAQTGETTDGFDVLVGAGLIEVDTDTGLVTTVLPFVAHKPWTMVRLENDGNLIRFVAGVLDAFALTALLARRVRIYDTCPSCGASVQVVTDPERIRRREPRSAVVVRMPFDGSRQGRYETARLACSPEHAKAMLTHSSNPDGVLQSIERLAMEAHERYAIVLR